MFGTVMRARVKPEMRDTYVQQLSTFEQRRQPDGFVSADLAWEVEDPNRTVMIVRFRDRASYMANAADPAQDREYREMLKYMDGEPEWIDVEYVD